DHEQHLPGLEDQVHGSIHCHDASKSSSMRRRLCLVNQPQRQTVTASTGLPGALYGTKYSDANGDGVRNGVLPGATTLNPIVLQQVALPNVPQAFGYYEPANSVLMAVTCCAHVISDTGMWGGTTWLYKVDATGAETP